MQPYYIIRTSIQGSSSKLSNPGRGPCGARGRKTGRLLARARKINQDRARIENAIYDRDCYPRPLCLSIREAHEPLSTDPPRDCQTPRGTEHLRIPRARMLAEQGDARRLCLTGQLQTKNQSAEFRAFANTQSKRLAPRRMRGVNRRPPDGLSDPQGHRTPTERLLARERRRVLPVVVVWWPAWQCACAGISMCSVLDLAVAPTKPKVFYCDSRRKTQQN